MRVLFALLLSPCFLFAQTSLKPIHSYSFDGNIKDTGSRAVDGDAHNIQFDSGYADKPQTALLFSDTNQYITLPVNLNPMEKGMSVSFWMYPEKQQKKRFLLLFQRENWKSPGWQISYQAYGGGGWAELWDLTKSGFINENLHFRGYPDRKYGKDYANWYHIAMTFSPNRTVKFYVNGILIHESRPMTDMGNFDSKAPIILGNYSPNMPEKTHKAFKGKIDNLQLFDFDISEDQVRELYFQDIVDLKHEWSLSNNFLKEKIRKETYIMDRKQERSASYCFFNIWTHKSLLPEGMISQFVGERRFSQENVQFLYEESRQRLAVVFPDSDTLIFNKVNPEDYRLGKFQLINPKFEPTDSDSLDLKYVEIHNIHTGKRYVSESKFSQEKFKAFIPKLESIYKNLEIGSTTDHLQVPLPNLHFETGKDSLLEESFASLDKIVALLTTYSELHLDISGHTDNVGNFQDNLALSVSRAKAVRDYLVKKGIDMERLRYGGYGSAKPIRSNETPAGRKLNRRVEIQVIDKQNIKGFLSYN